MKKNYLLLLLFVFTSSLLFSQHPTNLCPIEQWDEGEGSVGDFTASGSNLSNKREFVNGPENYDVLAWVGRGIVSGFGYEFVPDISKTYRYAIWLKQSHLNMASFFGPGGEILLLDGSSPTQNHFWSGATPTNEQWYLIVGFVHPANYTGTIDFGGVYNKEGQKELNAVDFKWEPTADQAFCSVISFFANSSADYKYFAPRVDIVNGNEPTIESIIAAGGGSSIWSEITEGAVYNVGSVGIGVDENDMDTAFKFLVDGDIKTKKIKVTLDGWADHVFDNNYPLLPLEEVEEFIDKNGHLPEIPSEETVLQEGIFLGEMDALLLRKIEELTLHLIDLNKDIKKIKQERDKLKLSHVKKN